MKPYLNEWLRAINDHDCYGIWQLVVSKGHANVKGILENDAERG